MKIKLLVNKFLLIILCLFLTGCVECCNFIGDSRINQFAILNNTEDTISFYFSKKFHSYMNDTVICYPYTETFIMNENLGFSTPSSSPCHPFIEGKYEKDEIEIITSSGRKLIKDITKNHNWRCAENSCDLWKVVFEINEEDLE